MIRCRSVWRRNNRVRIFFFARILFKVRDGRLFPFRFRDRDRYWCRSYVLTQRSKGVGSALIAVRLKNNSLISQALKGRVGENSILQFDVFDIKKKGQEIPGSK